MRSLALLLALLCGCSSTGLVETRSVHHGTGYALGTGEILTVIHPPYVGQKLWTRTLRKDWEESEVVRLGSGGVVVLRPVSWQPGDSGSPIFNEHGEVVAVVNAIPKIPRAPK